jgi:hypothetical protein
MCKELKNLNSKRTNNPAANWVEQTVLRTSIKCLISAWRNVSILSHERNKSKWHWDSISW